jgi:hypothetical protein
MGTVLGSGTLVKDGYTFKGWALSPNGAAAYNPGAQFNISDEVTLSAVWLSDTAPTYTVTYQPGVHGIFEAQSWEDLRHGSEKPPPPTPTGADGWEFIGWSPPPASTVTDNATYVAGWKQKIYDVKFEDWDGEAICTRDVAHGGNAAPPPDPEREGYIFTGWDHDCSDIREDTVIKPLYVPVAAGGTVQDNTAGGTHNSSWALINLILAGLGILLVFAAAVYALIRKKDHDYEFNHKRDKWLLAAVLSGIAGMALFIITQDTRQLMVAADAWTIVHAILLAASVICAVRAVRRRDETLRRRDVYSR